ncbi:MAG: hypothetical protein K6E59_00235 [Bacilli bacterium]|nr:hypothetical protein [Bacilli bacterium]
MKHRFEIHLLRDEAPAGDPDTYEYELGFFEDGLLEGVGRKARSAKTDKGVKSFCEFGLFHKGMLHGPGLREGSKGEPTYIGFFDHGEIVSPGSVSGMDVKPLEDFTVREGNETYAVTMAKQYRMHTKYGEIKMVFGTYSGTLVHFISGPQVHPLRNPHPYVQIHLKKGEKELLSIVMDHHLDGGPYVKTHDAYGFNEVIWVGSDVPFRRFHFEDVTVPQGKTSINGTLYDGFYSVRLYLPKSVQKINPYAITEPKKWMRFVEIFYEGTKEEWGKIDKEKTYSESHEDWYGSYYHGSDRYVGGEKTDTFPAKCSLIAVHCSDGDIEGFYYSTFFGTEDPE